MNRFRPGSHKVLFLSAAMTAFTLTDKGLNSLLVRIILSELFRAVLSLGVLVQWRQRAVCVLLRLVNFWGNKTLYLFIGFGD